MVYLSPYFLSISPSRKKAIKVKSERDMKEASQHYHQNVLRIKGKLYMVYDYYIYYMAALRR